MRILEMKNKVGNIVKGSTGRLLQCHRGHSDEVSPDQRSWIPGPSPPSWIVWPMGGSCQFQSCSRILRGSQPPTAPSLLPLRIVHPHCCCNTPPARGCDTVDGALYKSVGCEWALAVPTTTTVVMGFPSASSATAAPSVATSVAARASRQLRSCRGRTPSGFPGRKAEYWEPVCLSPWTCQWFQNLQWRYSAEFYRGWGFQDAVASGQPPSGASHLRDRHED